MFKVFCARSMHVAVAALSETFARNGGEAADIVFEPMGALQARLAAKESADVLILTAPAIDALDQDGAIVPGTSRAIASAPIGIATREGAPAPDLSTPAAFAAALASASRIALSDPAVGGTAGIYLRDLFARIGLADMIAAKTVPQKSGVAAAECVGRGDADLAMIFIPELKQGRGARILGPLPPPFGHATTYAAAVAARSPIPQVGRTFITELTAPDARAVWEKAGFEVPWRTDPEEV